MLPKPTTQLEKLQQKEYFKFKVKQAWNIVDHDERGYVDKEEISYLMRYLNQFPSEAQVRDYIIAKLEEDEPSKEISFQRFETFMLEGTAKLKLVLEENEFAPAPAQRLLAAFRILDPEGKGYIKQDVMKNLLTLKGIMFRKQEYEQFEAFALDKKTKDRFYYEEYVSRLIEENNHHLDYLTSDYETFKMNFNK